MTTKLHERCDARGLPLGFVLTPGQGHDVQGFAPLFRMIGDRIEAFLADRGYDADAIRKEIEAAGIGGRHVAQALVVALVVVVLDEGLDLLFEIAGDVLP